MPKPGIDPSLFATGHRRDVEQVNVLARSPGQELAVGAQRQVVVVGVTGADDGGPNTLDVVQGRALTRVPDVDGAVPGHRNDPARGGRSDVNHLAIGRARSVEYRLDNVTRL